MGLNTNSWRANFGFNCTVPDRGTTFFFGSWVCIANGSGSFDSHLANLPTLRTTTSESSSKLAGSGDHDDMLLPDLAKEIEMKLKDNSGSTRTQIDLKSNSTRIEIPLSQLVLGLRNTSSTYK